MSESEQRSGATLQQSVLDLHPTEQVLIEKTASDSPLERLPPDAFDNLLVVSTGMAPSEIEGRIEALGHNPRSVGVVPITATGFNYDGPLWVSQRVNPNDLTGISIEVSRGFSHLEPTRGWLTFDSICTLLMYAEEERLYRLLAWLMSNGRENEVRSVFSLARSMVADRTYDRLSGLCDSAVDEPR